MAKLSWLDFDDAHKHLANVIVCQHDKPARKLRGLRNLLNAGHTVSLAQFSTDVVLINGHKASWCVLEEWYTRKS